jgi:hypothetical protein
MKALEELLTSRKEGIAAGGIPEVIRHARGDHLSLEERAGS